MASEHVSLLKLQLFVLATYFLLVVAKSGYQLMMKI
jgi:hypothetical protein